MAPRTRRQQRHVLNRRWSIGLVVSVAAVVIAVVGIVLVQTEVLADAWVYPFFMVGAIGALSAGVQTIVRAKAGDDIDEAKL
ncbi:hypothetical protein [Aeromicrobium endophyticum]|uniref:hypothetical protein n=1 Tax=Aeromicrobium endophyticum TaxID=2292704 RepID=UPI0013141002|nr:hypothetical protein [Aeromicrobium endophyticum]